MTRTLTSLTALIALTALSACTPERTLAPKGLKSAASTVSFAPAQLPLLYVVDGVRLARDQVPTLTSDQISQVQVLKGRVALKQFGPDASYGVVVIRTKQAAPRS
jgi:hypothetical protein